MKVMILPLYKRIAKKIENVRLFIKHLRKRNLHFSLVENLHNSTIALDAKRKKFLYIKNAENVASYSIIDLKNLEKCTITRQYANIPAGALNVYDLHNFLRSVFLCFRFKNADKAIIVPIYESGLSAITDVQLLEEKARNWYTIINKSIGDNDNGRTTKTLSLPLKQIN